MQLLGIHHLTAVSAKIRENRLFYTQQLGMRLVKRSVNQDDVSAYHLFYADAKGSPGTDLTFFDWPVPRERRGTRSIVRTCLRVKGRASLEWWSRWFDEHHIAHGPIVEHDGRLGIAFDDPDYYVYSVYSTLLGGGMSSRLFQEVREKRGLAYSIYSFTGSFVDGGLFGIYAGTGAAEVEELIPVIGEQMDAVAKAPGDAEIERARNQIKAGLLMSLESTNARSEQLANQLLVYGRPIPTAEIVERIEAVDAHSAAALFERAHHPVVAVIEPLGERERVDETMVWRTLGPAGFENATYLRRENRTDAIRRTVAWFETHLKETGTSAVKQAPARPIVQGRVADLTPR